MTSELKENETSYIYQVTSSIVLDKDSSVSFTEHFLSEYKDIIFLSYEESVKVIDKKVKTISQKDIEILKDYNTVLNTWDDYFCEVNGSDIYLEGIDPFDFIEDMQKLPERHKEYLGINNKNDFTYCSTEYY